jgi:hypothetical protein
MINLAMPCKAAIPPKATPKKYTATAARTKEITNKYPLCWNRYLILEGNEDAKRETFLDNETFSEEAFFGPALFNPAREIYLENNFLIFENTLPNLPIIGELDESSVFLPA